MSGGNGAGEAPERRERVLFFRSGGELFAIEVASLEEVVVVGGLTPVPLAPEGVVGVLNHRGRIFTLVDFAHLAGLGREEPQPQLQAVFLHRPDMAVGIAVNAVIGIDRVPRRLLETPGGAAGGGASFISGLLDFEGRVAGIVDPGRLCERIAGLPDERTN